MNDLSSFLPESRNEIERNMIFIDPDHFRFSEDVGARLTELLTFALNDENFEFLFTEMQFVDAYNSIINTYVQNNPKYKYFKKYLKQKSFIEVNKCIFWFTCVMLLPEKYQNHLNEHIEQIYDRLALKYLDIRQDLISKLKYTVDIFTYAFNCIVCAVSLVLIQSEFPCSSLKKDFGFLIRFEEENRKIISGFSSSETESYHKDVFDLLPEVCLQFYPRTILKERVAFPRCQTEKIQRDVQIALALECKWRQTIDVDQKGILFEVNQQSPLMERALELHGLVRHKAVKPIFVNNSELEAKPINKVKTLTVNSAIKRISKDYQADKRRRYRDITKKSVNCVLQLERNDHHKKVVMDSQIGTNVLYDRLERKVMKKNAKNINARLNGKKEPPPSSRSLGLDHLDDNVALAINDLNTLNV